MHMCMCMFVCVNVCIYIYFLWLRLNLISPTKKDPLNKENCRLVSLPKVFERLLYKQIETFMSDKLSVKLVAFVQTIIHNIS